MEKLIFKIKKFIKHIFGKEEKQKIVNQCGYTDYQLEVFNCIRPGDIVMCKMPYAEEKLETIPTGHRNRPYLVLFKTRRGFYGLYCSTNYFRHKKVEESMILDVSKYSMTSGLNHKEKVKLCFILLEKRYSIGVANIQNKLASLDYRDIKKVNLAILDNNRKHNRKIELIEAVEEIKDYNSFNKLCIDNDYLDKPNKYYRNHKIGAIYVDIRGNEVIYLYSVDKRDYCIRYKEFNSINPRVIKTKVYDYAFTNKKINEKEMSHEIKELVAYQPGLYKYFNTYYFRNNIPN